MDIRTQQENPLVKILDYAWNFWKPKLKEAGDAFVEGIENAKDYYKPMLKETHDFWRPILKTSWDYWKPQLETTALFLNNEILDSIRKPINRLREKYGDAVAAQYIMIMSFWAPKVVNLVEWTDKEYELITRYWGPKIESQKEIIDRYWEQKTPGLHDAISTAWYNIEFIIALPTLLLDLYTTQGLNKGEKLKETMSAKFCTDQRLIARVNSLFEDLVPYTKNNRLRHFYRVKVLNSPYPESLNTGVTVFVTDKLAKMLDDNELKAILAHELAHGDEIHTLKQINQRVTSAGSHMLELMAEEIVWFLTGEEGDLLKRVMSQGNWQPFLEDYGAKAPALEIEADVKGAEILIRAGLSPEYLINAVTKLHEDIPENHTEQDADTFRYYPSLKNRINAINRVKVDAETLCCEE